MTMHCDGFLENKTNGSTEFQFFIGIMTLHVLGSLSAHHQELPSHTSAFVQFVQFGDQMHPSAGWNSFISNVINW
jgi:hypothetical protein